MMTENTAAKKLTNLKALEMAAKMAREAQEFALADKLDKMVESENNKREKAKDNAKTANTTQRRKTLARVLEVVKAITENGGEPRNSDWIGVHVPYLETSHKVTGVMRQGLLAGWAVKGPKIDKKVTYQATEAGIAALIDPDAAITEFLVGGDE